MYLQSEILWLTSESVNANFVSGLDTIMPGNGSWLIGGKMKDNSWHWTSRDGFTHTMTYNRWHPDEPNGQGKEQCLEMIAEDLKNANWYSNNFKWNDISCSTKRKYICERNEVVVSALG